MTTSKFYPPMRIEQCCVHITRRADSLFFLALFCVRTCNNATFVILICVFPTPQPPTSLPTSPLFLQFSLFCCFFGSCSMGVLISLAGQRAVVSFERLGSFLPSFSFSFFFFLASCMTDQGIGRQSFEPIVGHILRPSCLDSARGCVVVERHHWDAALPFLSSFVNCVLIARWVAPDSTL